MKEALDTTKKSRAKSGSDKRSRRESIHATKNNKTQKLDLKSYLDNLRGSARDERETQNKMPENEA